MNRLTKTGWPRPIVGGLPIPWISPSDELSTVNPARSASCASGAVCGVCGEGFVDIEVAWCFVRKETVPYDMSDGWIRPMDNSVMHKRCAQLALKHCPKLKQLTADGNLAIIATGGNLCEIQPADEAKGIYGLIPGKYCVMVETINDSLDGWKPGPETDDPAGVEGSGDPAA